MTGVTLEDVLAVVRLLAARKLSRQDAVHATWIIRNRAKAARRHRRETGVAHPRMGDGSIASAARNAMGDDEHTAPTRPAALLAAGAVACQVLAGDEPDPTGGALT